MIGATATSTTAAAISSRSPFETRIDTRIRNRQRAIDAIRTSTDGGTL